MTNEQNIIAVPVPVDAHTFRISKDPKEVDILVVGYPSGNHEIYQLPGQGHTFLGCVSFKDGEYIFDFYPSQLVQCISLHARLWKNYHGSTYWTDQCDSPEKSFVTRLQSMGHYWVNPLGEEPDKDLLHDEIKLQAKLNGFSISSEDDEKKMWDEMDRLFDEKLNAWRAAQEKCLRPDQKLAVMKIGG